MALSAVFPRYLVLPEGIRQLAEDICMSNIHFPVACVSTAQPFIGISLLGTCASRTLYSQSQFFEFQVCICQTPEQETSSKP